MALILVIEDSEYQRKLIKKVLEKMNYEIAEAANGREGLKMLEWLQPDCILLDLVMPEVNGWEVLQTLKDREILIPVVVFTADIQDISRQKCEQLGVKAYVNKPIAKKALLEAFEVVFSDQETEKYYLTSRQLQSLKNVINLGMEKAAVVLNTILQSSIGLHVPIIKVFSNQEIEQELKRLNNNASDGIQLNFKGTFSGCASLIFSTDSIAKIISVLTHEDISDDLNSIKTSALTEVGNIVINNIMGTIVNLLKLHIHYSVPAFQKGIVDTLLTHSAQQQCVILLANTQFSVDKLNVDGNIVILFEIGSFDILLKALE